MPALFSAWSSGAVERSEFVKGLLQQASGQEVRQLIMALVEQGTTLPVAGVAHSSAQAVQDNTDRWRSELMSCRARAWTFPETAGLLVGDHILVLTDGQQGVLLTEQAQHRVLPSSSSASLMLLCQTIVMAQTAVNAQELQQLTQQRLASSSTSLSEIEPIE